MISDETQRQKLRDLAKSMLLGWGNSVDLQLGDCLDLLTQVRDRSIHLILADLPYGTTHASFDKVLKNGQTMRSASVLPLDKLWKEYRRILTADGTAVLFGAQPFTSMLIQSNLPMYKYAWVWMKNKAANHVAVRFQPLKVHEDIVVFSTGGANTGSASPMRYYPQGVIWGEEIRTRKTEVKKSGTFRYNSLRSGPYKIAGTNYPRSVLEFKVPTTRIHPTQKPVDLLEYLIETYTNEGETVLDNCMGSGSAGVACKLTGRNFIGMEIDPDMFLLAKDWIDSINPRRT